MCLVFSFTLKEKKFTASSQSEILKYVQSSNTNDFYVVLH